MANRPYRGKGNPWHFITPLTTKRIQFGETPVGTIFSGMSGAQGGFESMSDNDTTDTGDADMGTIVSGIGSFIGGRQANEAQQEDFISNQQFNAQQAQLNRNFQASQQLQAEQYNTQMSDTAMQRRVQDLNAAGLNPLLAIAQGGASTPTMSATAGSQASTGGVPTLQNALGAGIQSAMQAQQIKQQGDLIDSQKGALDAQAAKASAEAAKVGPMADATIDNLNESSNQLIAAAKKLASDYDLNQQNIRTATADADFRRDFDDLTNKGIALNNQRLKLGMPELMADSKFWSGPEAAVAAAAKAGHQGAGALGGLIGGGAQALQQAATDYQSQATDWTSRKIESVVNWFKSYLPQGHWTP